MPAGQWLPWAERLCSPNADERPPGTRVELAVIHAISLPPGEFGGGHVERFFTNRLAPAGHPYFREIAGLEVSAHLFLRREGSAVQFVPFDRRAWHAGASCFRGRERCNDFSIGIELEGCDERPFEPVQYARLAETLAWLMARYPGITADRIVGHADIAPGRKTDPGPAFDWPRLRAALARRRGEPCAGAGA